MTEQRLGIGTKNRVDVPEAQGIPGHPARVVVSAVAVLLVGLWIAWWVASSRRNMLVQGHRTWVPLVQPFLACDFVLHIDHCARLYARGANLYFQPDDWNCALFPYPPMVLRTFGWVSWFSTRSALRIWLIASGLILLGSAVAAWRTRPAIGAWRAPLPVIAASLIFSTPAVFAMERGQADLIVLPLMLAASELLRGRKKGRDVAAGALLGWTAWLKYYPGLAVVALIALRRWYALAAFVIVAGLIGVMDRAEVRRSIENGGTVARITPKVPGVYVLKHSIVEDWKSFSVVKSQRWLRKIPPPVASALILLPAIVGVSVRFRRSKSPGALIFPYLLWLCAAATYAMPYSNDYNLTPLIMAALCVWDRRDPVFVHAVMGLLLLWWQPFALAIDGEIVFFIKLAALGAVGVSLARRAAESEVRERHSIEASTGTTSSGRLIRMGQIDR